MPINPCKYPYGTCSYTNSSHYLCDWNQISPANTAITSTRAANPLIYTSHFISKMFISEGMIVTPMFCGILLPISIFFMRSSNRDSTRVTDESIYSQHTSGLDDFNISLCIMTNHLCNYYVLYFYCSILLTTYLNFIISVFR